MRYSTVSTLAFTAAAVANPIAQALAPTSSAPAGCSSSYSGKFQIQVVNITSSGKRSVEKRQDGKLEITLADGVLTDEEGRIGNIVANYQFQFDPKPGQAGAIYTSGFSACSNGSLALGGSTVFYQCLSGGFYNLYDRSWAAQCSPINVDIIGASAASAAGSATGVGSVASDGQPTVTGAASAPIVQTSDGQVQATSAIQITQISDGQLQVMSTSAVAPVTQLSDGQPQAPVTTSKAAAVSQISDGQVQAATSTVAAVSQLSDGQVQAPTNATSAHAIGTGSPTTSSKTSTGSPIASYTGAASKVSAAGISLLAILGVVAAL